MFYKQTINNIKVVILSLDGGLLDLIILKGFVKLTILN